MKHAWNTIEHANSFVELTEAAGLCRKSDKIHMQAEWLQAINTKFDALRIATNAS